MKNSLMLVVVGVVLVGGFIFVKNQPAQPKPEAKITEEAETTAAEPVEGKCREEAVAIEGYGDKGKRLKNCFVEYPGEPSRDDKSYYVVEDICGQFTKEFIENLLGKQLTKIEPPTIAGLHNCTYFLTEKDNFLLNLEYLSIERQKKGNELMDYKTEENPLIPMENLVVYQEDGAVNVVYLVFNPEKFIAIRPINKNTFPGTELIDFAAKLAGEIKNYK